MHTHKNKYYLDNESKALIGTCPHCSALIQVPVNQINCGIFRHATSVKTGEPINPHTSEVECLKLSETSMDMYKFKLNIIINTSFAKNKHNEYNVIANIILGYISFNLSNIFENISVFGCLGPLQINKQDETLESCLYI